MDLFKMNCPYCREIMEYNATYDINDIDPKLVAHYDEIISLLCVDCEKELLLFLGKDSMALVRSVADVIKDMEVL